MRYALLLLLIAGCAAPALREAGPEPAYPPELAVQSEVPPAQVHMPASVHLTEPDGPEPAEVQPVTVDATRHAVPAAERAPAPTPTTTTDTGPDDARPLPATLEAPPADPLELLRDDADDPETARMLVAALIARATPDALAEAEQRLDDLGNAPAAWVAAMRLAIAGLAGENAELASRARRMYHKALAALPPEVGAVHVADDFGGVDARHSISFRPDEYVSVAFELRHFGVRERDDGMWDWQVRASARLLDEDGVPVPGFAPPPFTYSPQKPGSNPASHPGDRWTWFVYLLEARLPRDLAAGNYTIELSVTDAMGKEHHGAVVRHVEIRVR